MFKVLTQWIQDFGAANDQTTWMEWQKRQPMSHYTSSEIFQYFLSYRPQYQPLQDSCVETVEATHFIYCFGDFASLIVNPLRTTIINVFDYLTFIIEVYDLCKGPTRRITGDPAGILLIREVVKQRSLNLLNSHDFKQYNYDYTKIHGHTMAHFSLSTLLMRFISNYLKRLTAEGPCFSITGEFFTITSHVCKNALDNAAFGKIKLSETTTSVAIPINTPALREGVNHSNSWPSNTDTFMRCNVCKRVCERGWGRFNACLDCHSKRICSICSQPSTVITPDNLPKCDIHQDH